MGEGRPAQAPGDVLARSSALVADGRFDENLELLRRAAEDHRDDVDVVLRAAAAEQDADHARAAQLLERAVSLAPEDAGVLTRAGFGALALGDLDRALGWAEVAGRLTVDDPDFPLAFDLSHLGGRIFVAHGRDDRAERLLEIAFEELPQAPGYGLELAHLLARNGRDEEALAVIEKALAVRPDDQELTEERVLLRVNLYGPDELPPRLDHRDTRRPHAPAVRPPGRSTATPPSGRPLRGPSRERPRGSARPLSPCHRQAALRNLRDLQDAIRHLGDRRPGRVR